MLKMLQTNCKNNMLDSQVNIVKRLEKLSKWQEEQKRLLDDRQNMQRKMLGLEHQDIYEKMGFLHGNDIIQNIDKGGGDTSGDQLKKYEIKDDFDSDSEIKEIESRLFQSRNKTQGELSNQRNYDSIDYNNEQIEVKDIKPKRPYLKRGEGIKARYKISPESLRLNNLPRYKYADAHSKIKNIQRRKLAPRVKPSQKNSMIETNKRDSIDEIKHDLNEKQFHKMLANANPPNSSTPDTRPLKADPSSISITLPNVRLGETEIKETKSCEDFEENVAEHQVEPYVAITWSKVLNPQHLKPVPIHEIRQNLSNSGRNDCYDDENLSIFELLERQADQGAIDMNSSCVRKFLNNKMNNDKNEVNDSKMPINSRYADCRLRPTVEEVLRSDSDDENSFSDATDDRDQRCQTPGILTYLSAESRNESTLHADKVNLHVRFSEENTSCKYENGEDIISNNSILDEETSSNKSSYLFHQFKDALFSALLGKDAGDDKTTDQNMLISSPPSALTQELQEKSNIIKLRLEELEKEIASFRNNNIELLRAKQEYEMEKAHFSQERNEALDRLKDDKIQMEMYLHDERMKIEEERRKFEHQMRVQKQVITNKERKEIARLKDELETLQSQLKQKEQLHASAQARLRVQIRNMERDQKQLYEDIERLTKENKRLQNEKQKLEREGNNKMLMEINRNIAKLAPKVTNVNTCNASSEYFELNNRSGFKNSKALHYSSTQKSNGKSHRIMKAPPNTRNTSRTDLKNDSENSCALYKLDIDDRCNDSEGDLADDDDDDIISELRETQNCRNVKSVESTSHSNTSKDTVICKSDLNKETDRPNVKTHSVDIATAANRKRISKCAVEPEENYRREIINPDGSKDILYPNGNLKKISSDGMNIRMLYFNKDIKETNVNEGTVKYYYAETNTWHTTYLDGLEILEFPNGQTEHRYKNGVIEIHLPDNSVKITNPAERDKLEEWRFADGTNLIQMRNGDKVLMLPNGQKEIHTKLNKRREYPDGTVKLVYPDGSQETRYSNGRVRLKDKDGNLVMDTERI
ncbi:centromere protein J [Bactrocera neohumeralis]|uniref:centromere protein J n=1 Tax=Bactrocera tryoni TaxID=59916 RepID=UPI001A95A043|nr:centromere protein J [Bactrocera tryoni]XP_050332849.1 centromere protein J [Bactrocera neohumeralis]